MTLKSMMVSLCLLCSTTCFAQTASQQLAELFSNMHAMRANFTQTVSNTRGRVLQKSRGRMALQRPGQFYWQTLSPHKQLLIANGTYLWIYNVDLQQATRQRMSTQRMQSAAAVLSGSVAILQKKFRVKALRRSPGRWFVLWPRRKSGGFQWMQLQFVKRRLVRMRLKNNLGQIADFKFSNIVLNPRLRNSLFTFRAPRGVEVVKND